MLTRRRKQQQNIQEGIDTLKKERSSKKARIDSEEKEESVEISEKAENGVKIISKCIFCGKVFKKKTNLETHERVHTEEKPYSCKYCTKAFKTKDNVKSHERSFAEQFKFTPWIYCYSNFY